MNQETKRLQIANDKELRRLSYENRGWVRKITAYLAGKYVDDAEVENVRRDVIAMLIGAEERGESAEAVIGADYRAFCEEIRESMRTKTEDERTKDDALRLFTVFPVGGMIYCLSYTIRELFLGKAWSYEGVLGAMTGMLIYLVCLGIAGIFVRRRGDYIPWFWKEKGWRECTLILFVLTAVLQIVWYLRAVGRL